MAKKKKLRQKTGTFGSKKVSVDDAGGTVSCHLGIKLGASYSSADFNVGATVPIQPNESAEKAFDRVSALVEGVVDEKADAAIDNLWKKIQKHKEEKERKSKRKV